MEDVRSRERGWPSGSEPQRNSLDPDLIFLVGIESDRESLPLMLLMEGSGGYGLVTTRGLMVVMWKPNQNLDGGGDKVAASNKVNGEGSFYCRGETTLHSGGGRSPITWRSNT